MPILNQDTDERRRYYRIDDWVALEILPETKGVSDAPPLFGLLSEFHQLELESQSLLRQIADTDRTLASYLRLQSRRLDLLARSIAQDLLKQIGPPRRINLSEGGLRFVCSQPLAEGSKRTLRLLLLPQPVELTLSVEVSRCRQLENGHYEIALRFEDLSDLQRQQLARHILQKQAQERRLARGEKD